eukprot:TRINITY_DN12179_c0_g1_i1.p1 TRINITY_DN12179_c0_g1~~TRINITY_DN12179_c0_g1_i1.p1  ORF type:complete len:552 (-),score=108.99 TRINITY_DN12179_c0_g1_i1:248-1903(-)
MSSAQRKGSKPGNGSTVVSSENKTKRNKSNLSATARKESKDPKSKAVKGHRNPKSRRDKGKRDIAVEELYPLMEDPDWFQRSCFACKDSKKLPKEGVLTKMHYDEAFMPLYKPYKGLLDHKSLHLLRYSKQLSLDNQPHLPTEALCRISQYLQHSTEPRTLVVDLGSNTIKVGWAGDYNPVLIFPSIVGVVNWTPTPVGYDLYPYYGRIGHVEPFGGQASLTTHWNEVERIFDYILEKLGVISDETNILVSLPTVSPYNDPSNYDMMSKFSCLIFEKYSFLGGTFCTREALSMYGSGKTTGMVIHSGHRTTKVVPVYEGSSMLDIAHPYYFSGSHLNEYLATLLAERELTFNSVVEKCLLQDIKEKLCYVSLDPSKEDQEKEKDKEKEEGKGQKEKEKQDEGKINEDLYTCPHFLPPTARVQTDYSLGEERWKCPEKMFGDEYTRGIQHIFYDALYSATYANPELVQSYCGNIVLSGGSTKFPGFPERIRNEISALIPESFNVSTNVFAHPARQMQIWRGGSIFASMNPPALNLERFQELGPRRSTWSSLI